MDSSSRPLAVTIGEPAGIGPDIILKIWQSWCAEKLNDLPPFFLLADPGFLLHRAKQLGLSVEIKVLTDTSQVSELRNSVSKQLPVLPLANPLVAAPGAAVTEDAAGIVEAIERAVSLIATGEACGMVTLPINKQSLYETGFSYPGHTEFLAALAEQNYNLSPQPRAVMMLAGPDLKTVPITIHIPLAEVTNQLTSKLIVETGTIVAREMHHRFGIASPRLAFSGLNPHAGENGAMGSEDNAIIRPAIETLTSQGIDAVGPLPADTMFHQSARQKYDVALCMYHDQALIPAKALAFDDSVNVTLGLPFIRTSPDHGTAYDIAGTGRANISSTLAALRMAAEMSKSTKPSGPSA